MRQHYLVRPQHLNHHGTLYGGQMMDWADEAAFLAATIRFPRAKFVTVATDAINFVSPVKNGDIVEIETKIVHEGNTSCKVSIRGRFQLTARPIFDTNFVMVSVGPDGKACPMDRNPNIYDPGLSFVAQVLAGHATKSDIDLWVEAWHKQPNHGVWRSYDRDVTIQTALGMTEEQYARWVEDPTTLQNVLDEAWAAAQTNKR